MSNFWKDAYKDSWEQSATKENLIKEIIEAETGLRVDIVGLGAGTTDYISGSAQDNNHEKGDADLYIESKDIHIEVTGPNVPMMIFDDLWFRPDKLNNTYKKVVTGEGKLHLIVHVQDDKQNGKKIIRGINLNKQFFMDVKANPYPIITPKIRGNVEKYIEVNPKDKHIIKLEQIIELIKNEF